MSYQVLARKWRPRVFREMVGQEHVLKALINALDHNRLHHAYLFTGTRGVGKTTIARILAKCLNCETGVSSEPCDQCPSCLEINEGRFVDLIEVDAASRTKVEDTRELLDNVQYAPSKGRYKVYLIDEVHMLSGHSFNALLKTLEEPPPHIKFLLATTDPQKLPVTILSRCLQFNLKNMPPERIVQHLEHVLERELIPFEVSALWQLARAADGSMRDALSLTDQAIAFGNGKITEADVNAMLGTIDPGRVYELVRALAVNDGAALLDCVARMAEHAPDFSEALARLTAILHRIAIAQVLPESIDNTFGDRELILEMAGQMPGEDIQLFFQTALLGRRDLPLAPDARGGFEMVLLRMLAFRPQGIAELPSKALPAAGAPQSSGGASPLKKPESSPAQASRGGAAAFAQSSQQPKPANGPAQTAQVPEPNVEIAQASVAALKAPPISRPESRTADAPPAPSSNGQSAGSSSHASPPNTPVLRDVPPPNRDAAPVSNAPSFQAANRPRPSPQRISLQDLSPQRWNELVFQLPIGGVIQNTVMHCQLVEKQGNALAFILDERNSTLYDESHQRRLADILSDYFREAVSIAIRLGPVSQETPSAQAARTKQERHASAVQALKSDPVVRDVMATFAATLREDSVIPLDGRKS